MKGADTISNLTCYALLDKHSFIICLPFILQDSYLQSDPSLRLSPLV